MHLDVTSPALRTPDEWEACWAPYDPPTYAEVLDCLRPDDHVVEIGAGDFRLARQMAQVVRQVTGIENQPALVAQARAAQQDNPLSNLTLLLGDARRLPFPPGITAGVLLMRHCSHFRLYAEKLRDLGCRILVTNARWRFGVEAVNLQAHRQVYAQFDLGWYACWCGSAGFKPGAPERLTTWNENQVHEVESCPACSPGLANTSS